MKEINLLLTGSSGFIGSHALPVFKKKFNVSTLSLKDNNSDLAKLGDVDVIVHLAGIAHQTKSISQENYMHVNYQLPLDLARTAKEKGVRHFIFLSTIKVYGEKATQPLNEISPCYPDDDYARSKYNAELEIMKLNSSSFLVSIIRPALVYGKGVKGNLARLIYLIKTYPVLPLGEIKNRRSLVYVENLLALMERIIEKRTSGIFIACDVNTISTSSLISAFARHMNRRIILIPFPGFLKFMMKRMASSAYSRLFGSFVVDSSQTNQVLEFSAPYSVEEGIKRMFL